MSSRQQLDVRNLSLGMRHLVNAYEVEEVRCNLQVTLCDPYLGALSARYYNKSAIINPLPLPLPFYLTLTLLTLTLTHHIRSKLAFVLVAFRSSGTFPEDRSRPALGRLIIHP